MQDHEIDLGDGLSVPVRHDGDGHGHVVDLPGALSEAQAERLERALFDLDLAPVADPEVTDHGVRLRCEQVA